MPVLDCDKYFQPAMRVALRALKHEMQEAGHELEGTKVSYVNVYLGAETLRWGKGVDSGWHICCHREHRVLAVVFHFVQHGDLVKTRETKLKKHKGLCVTLAWTTTGEPAAELADALDVADNIVAQAEMVLGRPIPLPLKKTQIPALYGIRTIELNARKGGRGVVSFHRPQGARESSLQQVQIEHISELSGVLGPPSDCFGTPLAQAMYLSAKWQRQAIRAEGVEDWAAMVVASNTWIETLLVRLAILFNEAVGNPILNPETELIKKGFVRFASCHLGQKFLGGNWDHKSKDTVIGKWLRDCYLLRNKVVHQGHFPVASEAKAAYAASNSLAWCVTRKAAKIADPKLAEFLKPFRMTSAAVDLSIT